MASNMANTVSSRITQIKNFGTPDAGGALEHFRSTGIRDGLWPNGNDGNKSLGWFSLRGA